jgi:outer membrane protein
MKMIFKRILIGLVLASALTLPALGEVKIATIDLRKVFDNYWKREQAQAAFNEKKDEMQKDLKGFMDDYKKTQDDYDKLIKAANDQSVTPEEREKRKSSAESKLLELKTGENTIRQFQENARDQLDSQLKRMRDSLLVDIRAAINAKAKAGGFTMVIDVAAESFNQTPIVLYTTGENDMTDSILSQLNAAAPPPAPDTPKPGDKSPAKGDIKLDNKK